MLYLGKVVGQLDKTFSKFYDESMTHVEKIQPIIYCATFYFFGVETNLPPNYESLKYLIRDTIKECGNSIRKFL